MVTLAMLWLAARRSVGTPSATLLGRLQRQFCLGSPRCSPSHLEYSFPGFLIGTFDLCASWRTERIAMHGSFSPPGRYGMNPFATQLERCPTVLTAGRTTRRARHRCPHDKARQYRPSSEGAPSLTGALRNTSRISARVHVLQKYAEASVPSTIPI